LGRGALVAQGASIDATGGGVLVLPASSNHMPSLVSTQHSTRELREDWAARKAKALALRRLELVGGAPRATGTGLASAVKRYFDDHPQLSAETLTLYRSATNKFLAWATKAGIESVDDLDKGKLVAFSAVLVKEPKRVCKPGGFRGERA